MSTIRNVFAVLVHENQDCVIDLVRNLHALDPASLILLYNGGHDARLLADKFPFEQFGAVVHPAPRPAQWGRLHQFALDCMSWACDNQSFDTLTIVDSDQLATRPDYSDYLADWLAARPRAGVLGNSPVVEAPGTRIGPAEAALREIDLWRPLLREFPAGEEKFVHWCFWPSTVFTADAARDLVALFATNQRLRDIMAQTRIWATEEIIPPTLVALLGYEICSSPCSYDFVKYRVPFSLPQLDAALDRTDVFWIHPVPRRYDDPLRKRIRERFNHYLNPPGPPAVHAGGERRRPVRLLLTTPDSRAYAPHRRVARGCGGRSSDSDAHTRRHARRRAGRGGDRRAICGRSTGRPRQRAQCASGCVADQGLRHSIRMTKSSARSIKGIKQRRPFAAAHSAGTSARPGLDLSSRRADRQALLRGRGGTGRYASCSSTVFTTTRMSRAISTSSSARLLARRIRRPSTTTRPTIRAS